MDIEETDKTFDTWSDDKLLSMVSDETRLEAKVSLDSLVKEATEPPEEKSEPVLIDSARLVVVDATNRLDSRLEDASVSLETGNSPMLEVTEDCSKITSDSARELEIEYGDRLTVISELEEFEVALDVSESGL